MVTEHHETGSENAWRRPVRIRQGLLRRFDQISVRHPGRACWLAPTALDTRVHEIDELIVDRRSLPRDRAHRGDSSAR